MMMTNYEGSSSCYAIIGMRFLPLDEELISYLLKFVSGKLFECGHIRDNVDLYGNKKSCDIFDELSPKGEATDVNYFFTQLKRKSVNGKNFIRTMVGGGIGKGLDKGKDVLDKIKRSTIELKKTIRYDDHNDDEDQQYAWRMQEYCISDKILAVLRKCGQIRREDFVLCRIKRKLLMKKGFCANISIGLCSNIHMEISSSGDHENITLDSSEQPMLSDNNVSSNGNNASSEDEIRSHLAYLSYYFSLENHNPRLPPPLLSREYWRVAQRVQAGGGSALGGVEGWRRNNLMDQGDGSSLFTTMQPGLSLQRTEDEMIMLRKAAARNLSRGSSTELVDRGSPNLT
ncbi:hypothetical protein K7X08_030480 [Anisodus acutangulus]|uniref:NAC domain-containing protein n=1 Tax=Anisodus acutangulus TaxID=402998 RepID=A0A9Q1QVI7_9SOLA|nr:hypothetical protein K7X08_030480 [Anisodus acutangulus]